MKCLVSNAVPGLFLFFAVSEAAVSGIGDENAIFLVAIVREVRSQPQVI